MCDLRHDHNRGVLWYVMRRGGVYQAWLYCIPQILMAFEGKLGIQRGRVVRWRGLVLKGAKTGAVNKTSSIVITLKHPLGF